MTLGTLHDTIQELTGFDNDHLFTFFMARGPRGQRTSIVDTGQWEGERERLYEIPLGVFPLEQGMKLFYWFDFGDDWMFRIQQRGQPKPEDSGSEYPKVIREVGPQPVQYPELGIRTAPSAAPPGNARARLRMGIDCCLSTRADQGLKRME